MRSYLEMLRQRNLATFWVSQVLSAIGDQLHMIAVIWISVQVAGAKAGFVVSAGAVTGLVVGLFAGPFADRWDRRKSMIVCDVVRGLAVAVLAMAAHAGALQLWHMGAVAVVCAALSCLFEPCLLASMPTLADTPAILRAMNSLMMMTFRIARLIAPVLAAWLLSFVPIYAFFCIDSMSFFLSAVAIWSLGTHYQWKAVGTSPLVGVRAVMSDIASAAVMTRRNAELSRVLAISLFGAGLWSVVYMVGLPLLVKQSHLSGATGVGGYAGLICAYGVGNVICNIIIGTWELDKRAVFNTALGCAILGLGFGIAGFAPNMLVACIGCAVAAVGGPVGDVAQVNLFARLPDDYRGKINSFSRFVTNLGSAIGLLAAPWLFSLCTGQQGIAYGAASLLICGFIGMMLQPRAASKLLTLNAASSTDETRQPATLEHRTRRGVALDVRVEE